MEYRADVSPIFLLFREICPAVPAALIVSALFYIFIPCTPTRLPLKHRFHTIFRSHRFLFGAYFYCIAFFGFSLPFRFFFFFFIFPGDFHGFLFYICNIVLYTFFFKFLFNFYFFILLLIFCYLLYITCSTFLLFHLILWLLRSMSQWNVRRM